MRLFAARGKERSRIPDTVSKHHLSRHTGSDTLYCDFYISSRRGPARSKALCSMHAGGKTRDSGWLAFRTWSRARSLARSPTLASVRYERGKKQIGRKGCGGWARGWEWERASLLYFGKKSAGSNAKIGLRARERDTLYESYISEKKKKKRVMWCRIDSRRKCIQGVSLRRVLPSTLPWCTFSLYFISSFLFFANLMIDLFFIISVTISILLRQTISEKYIHITYLRYT